MRYLNTTLILIVIFLSTGLLIGNRLSLVWAGGDGYETHTSGFVGEREYQRGKTISSGNNFYLLEFCQTNIWLDINTEIKLIDGRINRCAINVLQGRVVVRGNITIITRELKTTISGLTSFVHYSWRDEIEIAKILGNTTIHYDTLNKSVETLIINTNNYQESDLIFNPTISNASAFYSWALNNTYDR